MKFNRYILVTALFVVTLMAYALPSQKIRKTVRQSDGTLLELQLFGDEHLHFYRTVDDETPVVLNSKGDYCYAIINSKGISSSDVLAHNRANRTTEEIKKVTSFRTTAVISPFQCLGVNVGSGTRKASFIGKKKGLIILANFSDTTFINPNSKALFDSLANYRGYHTGYNQGSIKDYFMEQSNGQFDLTFDVVGPVNLPKPLAYYGSNNNMGDLHPGEMVATACQLAADSVNYADYDWNGDGEVEQVVVIYAGYGEAMGAPENTVWPQENTLLKSDYMRQLNLDGMIVNKFACTCELYGNYQALKGRRLVTGPGPICHEYSHCLGLPDFYSTDESINFVMGSWDLMDDGCYNNGTYCPAGYTGYERWFCGWKEPIVLDKPASVKNMKALSEGGDVYVVYNDQFSGAKNEFYVLENRQHKGFDSFLYGKGLLVTHVTYNENKWKSNTVNNSKEPGMCIIPANNLYTYKDSAEVGQAYPFNSNDSLTNRSIPAAAVYNSNKDFEYFMNRPITDITLHEDKTISFNFMKGISDGLVTGNIDEDINGKEVTVFDLSGRQIGHFSHFNQNVDLDSGTYIIRCHGICRKIIINNK